MAPFGWPEGAMAVVGGICFAENAHHICKWRMCDAYKHDMYNEHSNKRAYYTFVYYVMQFLYMNTVY